MINALCSHRQVALEYRDRKEPRAKEEQIIDITSDLQACLEFIFSHVGESLFSVIWKNTYVRS